MRLEQAGKDVRNLSRDDVSSFDEFHGGGRESTREMAEMAGLQPGMEVLDVGSGIGGPARTLAAEFGCRVTGIDLTSEFCRAAEMLTEKLRLTELVKIKCSDAIDMPFDRASFDVVWSQNTFMNIEDKTRLFSEIYRVLRPGGILAFETVLAGPKKGMFYPVFWASSPSLNFLISTDQMKTLLTTTGFCEEAWEDVTERTIKNQQHRKIATESRDAETLSLAVVVDTDVQAKIDNVLRNNIEGCTVRIQAVYKRNST